MIMIMIMIIIIIIIIIIMIIIIIIQSNIIVYNVVLTLTGYTCNIILFPYWTFQRW